MDTFRPGIYKHYKGGMYTAIQLVTHHETKRKYVVYISHTHGSVHLREYEKTDDPETAADDCWTDRVFPLGHLEHGCLRFEYVGPA